MKKTLLIQWIAALCISTALASTAVLADDQSRKPEHMNHPTGASGDLHKAMMDGMKPMHSMQMTGDVDRDFAAMMIKHHEAAVAMAKVEQDKGKNAELKAMAQKMAAQQQKEIDELKRYTR
jgi:uncharacterized protein (DUF305 family)